MRYLIVLLLLTGCATAEPRFDADIETALENEAKAYAAMLREKMERGEMTEQDARYLYTKKTNELADRAVAQQRARHSVRQPRRQETTACRPDGFGGVRCETR